MKNLERLVQVIESSVKVSVRSDQDLFSKAQPHSLKVRSTGDAWLSGQQIDFRLRAPGVRTFFQSAISLRR